MAQTGYTPIQLYYSTTASAVPTNTNLANGELAINITDGKLYYKDNTGTVKLLAGATSGPAGGSNTQVQYNSSGVLAGSSNLTFDGTSLTLGGNPTLSAGTANGVTYLNGSKVLTSGSALTFDGTNLGVASTSGSDVTLLTLTSNSGIRQQFNPTNSTGTKYNWRIDVNGLVDQTWSLVPSTAVGGSTFSTPVYQAHGNGTQIWSIGSSEQMRLTSTGLGIGTSSPSSKLEVAGSDAGIKINATGSYAQLFYYNGASLLWNAYADISSGQYRLGNNSGTQLTLTSSGNLGIGTTNEYNNITLANNSNSNGITWNRYDNIFSEYSSGALYLSSNYYPTLGASGYKTTLTASYGAAGISVSGTGGASNGGLIAFYVDTATSKTAGAAFTPTERLRIAETGAIGLSGANYGSSGQVLTSQGSGSPPIWASGGGGSSQWTTSGTQIYYNTGNVGIGTASPDTYTDGGKNLTILSSTAGSRAQLALVGNQSNVNEILGRITFTNTNSTNTNYRVALIDGIRGSDNNSGYLTFSTGYTTTPSERVRITETGVVGINNTNPSADATRFVINQSSSPSGTLPTIKLPGGWDNQGAQDNIGTYMRYGGGGVPNGTLLTARIGNNTSFVLNNSGSDNNIYGAGGRPPVYIYSGPSGSYSSYEQPPASSFSAGGSLPRMAIYSEMTGMYDGVVCTGFSVKLAGSYGGTSVRDVICAAVQATTAFGTDRGYGTSYGFYANVSSNITANYAFYAAAGDAAKPGGGSWSSTSDARVKNILGQYARGLDDVLKINVVDFEYNGKGGHNADGRRYTGVIAQEMQEIFPEMVRTHRTKLEETDTEDTDLLMVDNSALVYALVNAIKELKADFDAYKASHP